MPFELIKSFTEPKYSRIIYFLASLVLPGYFYFYLVNPSNLMTTNMLNILPLIVLYSLPQYYLIKLALFPPSAYERRLRKIEKEFRESLLQNFSSKAENINSQLGLINNAIEVNAAVLDNNQDINLDLAASTTGKHLELLHKFNETQKLYQENISQLIETKDQVLNDQRSNQELGILLMLGVVQFGVKLLLHFELFPSPVDWVSNIQFAYGLVFFAVGLNSFVDYSHKASRKDPDK